jgi:alkanesulfonate monooxygenase SsuD/methylene tetrahydromethanopterin reductase-like flavin-dependent oxidoreductase (luciferase family)
VTAEPRTRTEDTARRVVDAHVFLLAGQFPGMTHAEALSRAVAAALTAERVGFAGAWIAEHHFLSYGVCPSALAFAANLLGRTDRLRVGTAACILSNRHPVAVAEEAILLDELSGGRLALGVGRGGPWVDLEVFGTGLDRFEHGFADALDLVRDWLSGRSPVGGRGPFAFRPVPVVPLPRRPVPLWVAATSRPTVDIAAARGLPLLLGMHADDVESAGLLRRYAEVAERHAHDPAAVPHASAHLAFVDDTTARAEKAVIAALPALVARVREYTRIVESTGPTLDPLSYVEHLVRVGAVGDARRCAERLAASVEATGVRQVLLMVEAAGDPAQTVERLAAEVLPALP